MGATALPTTVRAFLVTALVLVTAAPAVATSAEATSTAPGPVLGRLLPVPALAPGQTYSLGVADITPGGVVGGSIDVVTELPDGSQAFAGTAQRWLPTPAGWRRQQLAEPAGAGGASVVGLTDAGEAAGSMGFAEGRRAVRWSVDGRRVVVLGGPGSEVSAVGPAGPWAVHTYDPGSVGGSSELVDRRGRQTALSGTPELDAGYDRYVLSVAGPRTALVGVASGSGRGGSVTPVLYRDGATIALPAVFTYVTTSCLSQVRPDGGVAHSRVELGDDGPRILLARHVGGVPGREVPLAPPGRTGSQSASLGCDGNGVSDRLAADGGVAGAVFEPGADGWTARAAYWDARGRGAIVPLGADERSAVAVAVATGGRMVIRAETASWPTLSLWRRGVLTPLTLPAGWTVRQVVELTDTGLLLAEAADDAGSTRPVVWDLSRR